jgi:DNA-binding Lrp family transcriptional regulator
MKRSRYGYIEFKNPDDVWAEPEIRKPTFAEREEVILNLVRDNSGRTILLNRVAKLLGISERTVQRHLKNLQEKGLVRRFKQVNRHNRQRQNRIEYTGPDTPRSDGDLTLQKLYDVTNPCGVRDWDWEDYKFIPGYYVSREEREGIQAMYSELLEKKQTNAEKKARLKREIPD